MKVTATEDRPLSEAEWDGINFPFNAISKQIETHVDIRKGKEYI